MRRAILHAFLVGLALQFGGCSSAPKHSEPTRLPASACAPDQAPAALRLIQVHYGDSLTVTDLERIWSVLSDRFLEASGCLVRLERVVPPVLFPLKALNSRARIPVKLAQATFQGRRRPEDLTNAERVRLSRLRYYYLSDAGATLRGEVLSNAQELRVKASQYDAIVVTTSAQFEGLGFGIPSEMAVTEFPVEIAWSTEGGGSTEYPSDAELVDELIHELGHVVGLNHAAAQCSSKSMNDYAEWKACCARSENANDVMSYCRERNKVPDGAFFGFEACNRAKILERVVPRLQKGRTFTLETRGCE